MKKAGNKQQTINMYKQMTKNNRSDKKSTQTKPYCTFSSSQSKVVCTYDYSFHYLDFY